MMEQQALQPARVPDPFAMLAVPASRKQGRLVSRQHHRRASMLATARRVLAEAPEQFTLTRVASECGVTVQTLRNAFGRREELLASAFNDHTSAVWRTLAGYSSGPAMFLELAQIYYRCAVTHPAFLKAMVTSAMANVRPLNIAQRHGSGIKSAHFRDMARNDMLRPGVDAERLARHITRLNTFMMYEWAQGGEAAELRREMIDGNRVLLMGAVTHRHAERLETWEPSPVC